MQKETIPISGREPISGLMLERYLCDEVAPHEKEHIEQAIRESKELQRTMEMLRISNGEIIAAYPAEEMVREIELKAHNQEVAKRLQSSRRQWLTGMMRPTLSFPSAALALLVFISIPVTIVYLKGRLDVPAGVMRIKGQLPYLTVYRQAEAGYEKLSDRATVAAKDRIQLGYVSAGKKYGFIFSVDGNGSITVHYPGDASRKATDMKLESGREFLLATSFELDDAPSFERFFFLASDDTIDVRSVIAECERQFDRTAFRNPHKNLSLSGQYGQMSITLFKEERK
jgi:hypothetical protein